MTDTRRTQDSSTSGAPYTGPRGPRRTAWLGWIVFAGVMMIILGAFEFIEGLVALVNDEYYVVASQDLVVSVDYTTWGWVHLLLGVVVAAAGVGLMVGQMWARVIGVIVAALSAVVNIAFLTAYPVGATIVITIDIVIIYALTVHGGEAASDYE